MPETTPVPQSPDRLLAALAGGAAASAHDGRPSEASTLQMFLLDGLTEALEWANDGAAADEAACLWLAGLRWRRFATGSFPPRAPEPLGRTIDDDVEGTAAGGLVSGDPANVEGLSRSDMGTVARPVPGAPDGPGVLARAALVAFLPLVEEETTAKLARDAAALTHGQDAQSAATTTALLVRSALAAADPADVLRAFLARDRPTGVAGEGLRRAIEAVLDGSLTGDPDIDCLSGNLRGITAPTEIEVEAAPCAEALAGLAARWHRQVAAATGS